MDDDLIFAFEEQRTQLEAVACRLLGSVHEAEDAVYETWLRVAHADTSEVEDLPAWLTTVVARVCLDQLRTRRTRPERLAGLVRKQAVQALTVPGTGAMTSLAVDPADRAEQADFVGRALQIVLDTLSPAERLAFCLHDLFAVPFDDIAVVLGRSPGASRQLASRGRRRVRGQVESVEADRLRQRQIVQAFMLAAQEGRFESLLDLMDPEVVLFSDETATAMGSPAWLEGAVQVAAFFNGRARSARRAELDGFAAAMWSQRGEVQVVVDFTIEDGLITEIHLLATELSLLDLRSSGPFWASLH